MSATNPGASRGEAVHALARLRPASGLLTIGARPGARVEAVRVGEGDVVRAGDLLAILEGHSRAEKQLALAPSRLQDFIRGVRETFERAAMAGDTPVLLTSPGIRPFVRQIIERFRATTMVMSQNEIHAKAKIRTLGQI